MTKLLGFQFERIGPNHDYPVLYIPTWFPTKLYFIFKWFPKVMWHIVGY